jgi:hypothetical protein
MMVMVMRVARASMKSRVSNLESFKKTIVARAREATQILMRRNRSHQVAKWTQ